MDGEQQQHRNPSAVRTAALLAGMFDVCDICPGVRSKIYSWPICLGLSRFGVQRWSDNRRVILTVIGGFITFVCIILNVIGCLGLSTDLDFIRDIYWAKYTYLQMNVYMNLSTLRLGTVTKTWTEMGLESCGDASDGLQVMMITSTVLLLFVLLFCLKRGSIKIGAGGDGTGVKLGALFSLFAQALITYIMLGDFGERCIQPINDEYNPSYGSGFICPLLASCLMGIVFILHLFVPCPDQTITSSEEAGLINSASKVNPSEDVASKMDDDQEPTGRDIWSGNSSGSLGEGDALSLESKEEEEEGASGEDVGMRKRQFVTVGLKQL